MGVYPRLFIRITRSEMRYELSQLCQVVKIYVGREYFMTAFMAFLPIAENILLHLGW